MYDCSTLIIVYWRRKSKYPKVLLDNEDKEKPLKEIGQSWFGKQVLPSNQIKGVIPKEYDQFKQKNVEHSM